MRVLLLTSPPFVRVLPLNVHPLPSWMLLRQSSKILALLLPACLNLTFPPPLTAVFHSSALNVIHSKFCATDSPKQWCQGWKMKSPL